MASEVITAKEFLKELADPAAQGAHVANTLIDRLRHVNHEKGILEPSASTGWLQPEHALQASQILAAGGWKVAVESTNIIIVGQAQPRKRLTLHSPE